MRRADERASESAYRWTRGPIGAKNWQSTLEASKASDGRMRAAFSALQPETDPHLSSLVIHDIQHLYLDKQVAGAQGDYDPERMETALTLLIEGPRTSSAGDVGIARRGRRLDRRAKPA